MKIAQVATKGISGVLGNAPAGRFVVFGPAEEMGVLSMAKTRTLQDQRKLRQKMGIKKQRSIASSKAAGVDIMYRSWQVSWEDR